jgi:hypothetical protein
VFGHPNKVVGMIFLGRLSGVLIACQVYLILVEHVKWWRHPALAAMNHLRRKGKSLDPEGFRFSLASGDPFLTYTTCFGVSSGHLFL